MLAACQLALADKAFDETMKKAKAGDAKAQFNLGFMYDDGIGVSASYKEAIKWYTKAAEQGNAEAQYYLALHCENLRCEGYQAAMWLTKAAEQGHVMAQLELGFILGNRTRSYKVKSKEDEQEAIKWYTKAAEQGNAEAQYRLGYMYENGIGVAAEQNYDKEALNWYSKSAEQGFVHAQRNLAAMYYGGYGVSRNYEEAFKWYTKAAEQGHSEAQFNLGFMYDNGLGVSQDYKQAYVWFSIAVESGESLATDNRDFSVSKLTLKELEEAKTEAKTLMKKIEQTKQNNVKDLYERTSPMRHSISFDE